MKNESPRHHGNVTSHTLRCSILEVKVQFLKDISPVFSLFYRQSPAIYVAHLNTAILLEERKRYALNRHISTWIAGQCAEARQRQPTI